MLVPLDTEGVATESLQDCGDSGAPLSCKTKPVDGAFHDKLIPSLSEWILIVLRAGNPATRTGMEVTTGWPVM